MPLPTPEAGLVISFSYLLRHEYKKGNEEGRKDQYVYGFLPPILFEKVKISIFELLKQRRAKITPRD